MNGSDCCSVDAGACLFDVEQAGARLCGRGERWGYLAVHRDAVVAHCGLEIVRDRRSVMIGYGQCSS